MANLYDLKKFDLNLLVIFRMYLSTFEYQQSGGDVIYHPSAVSQSLQRLRQQLNDPLFVRVGKGITPTTACVNLHYHLQQKSGAAGKKPSILIIAQNCVNVL